MAKNMINDSLHVDESSLTHVSVLGRGGFGSVSLKRDSNFGFYAKKSSSMKLMKILDKELRVMLRFHNHPRIVQASSSLLHVGTKPKRCYIYMEFASRGTLHNMISEFRGRPMPENMIRRAVLMMLEGLEALHSQGYVHCDIKPANVLVFPSKILGEPWDLKLADFSLTKEPFVDSKLVGGTKQYMPPESSIGPAFDIWSLGCVILQMFGCSLKTKGLYMGKLPELASPVANDFLRRCMEVEPSGRATAAELLNHPFVTQRATCVPQPEIPSFTRLPCVIKNNVIEFFSKRQRGPVMMR